MPWIVLRTKPLRERWAAENVARQGFEHYHPQIIEFDRRTAHLKLQIARPLFPGFLFVLVGEQWYCLLSTFGVIGAIMRGEQPDTMPERAIYQLHMRENHHGYIDLPKAPPRVRISGQAKITKGPLAGHTGLVTGMRDNERIKILFDILGRKTEVLVAERDLIAA
jgi:transcriptional antiterminator RfaH